MSVQDKLEKEHLGKGERGALKVGWIRNIWEEVKKGACKEKNVKKSEAFRGKWLKERLGRI